MNNNRLFNWLLAGDVSIQYQAYLDLLSTERQDLQHRIASEGWGAQFLSERKPDGHWGDRFYQPKWTSTHYTLLDLRNLCLHPDNSAAKETIDLTLASNKAKDGGIQLGPSSAHHSDVCVNGMFLNYASWFRTDESKIRSIVDNLLSVVMPDGGFNCRTFTSGARHSSLHSTLSVLEGLNEYLRNGYVYRLNDVEAAKESAGEFILQHRLFLSDRTGEIIRRDFLKMTYPCRWRYDILRAMDYFRHSGMNWDERMAEAMDVILSKRNKDGTWNIQAAHPGRVHFVMEKAGMPSRWNTLRAMRVMKHFGLLSSKDMAQ